MIRHIAKLLDAIWYLSMGLFLGLTGGLVLSVITTFRGARELNASPGVEPFSDPMFAEYHNEAVAGFVGQNLFMVGGTVALVLLGVASIARLADYLIMRFKSRPITGGSRLSVLRNTALGLCCGLMLGAAINTQSMNADWPDLYDHQATESELIQRRIAFEKYHNKSEKIVSAAWLAGLFALAMSPWCRRIADVPLQSGDGKKESNQEEAGQAKEA